MVTAWPLIGRESDLDALERFLSPTSTTAGIVLAGAPGVGKTTLVRLAAARHRAGGSQVRWLAGTETARSLPFGAVAQHVRLPDGLDAARALRFAAEEILDDHDRRPVVVAVDDAHLLDPLSATLVHQLTLSGRARLVVSVRSGETAPDAVTAMWKDHHLEHRTIGPLSADQSAVATETYLDGPLDRQCAQRLWELAEGNPLYLRQLVESWVESGTLRPVAGVWRVTGRSIVSGQLADVLTARIGRFGPDVGRVVALLSCCEPLPVDVLAALSAPDALELSERLGVVRISTDGRSARLSHPLFGEVVRTRTASMAGRRLRGELAIALGTGILDRDDAGTRIRRATLILDSDMVPDVGSLVQGAWDAIHLGDLPLGERLARAAVDAGGGFQPSLALAYAMSWQGRGDEAEGLLAPLAAAAITELEDVRVTVPRVANMFWTLHRHSRAEEILDGGLGRITDPVLIDDLRGLRAALTFVQGGASEAAPAAARVLAAHGRSARAQTWAAAALAPSLAALGRGADAAEVARRSERVAVSGETSVLRQSVAAGGILGLLSLGDVVEARIASQRYVVLAAGELCTGAFAALFSGWTELTAGRIGAAERALSEAVAGFTLGDPADWTFVARTALVRAQVAAGHLDRARESLRLAVDGYRASASFAATDLLLARAWLAAADGAMVEALARAREAADLARGRGQWGYEVAARHTAARFGDRSAANRLRDLAARVQGPAAALMAAHATALAADDPAALLDAARRLDRCGLGASATDAAAQAVVSARQEGDQVLEGGARAILDDLLTRIGPTTTPALGTVPVSGLTIREREIAALVAHGLSNRQIAARLVVSIRTVEGHIYHACQKLQVDDRAGLAAVAGHAPEPFSHQ